MAVEVPEGGGYVRGGKDKSQRTEGRERGAWGKGEALEGAVRDEGGSGRGSEALEPERSRSRAKASVNGLRAQVKRQHDDNKETTEGTAVGAETHDI